MEIGARTLPIVTVRCETDVQEREEEGDGEREGAWYTGESSFSVSISRSLASSLVLEEGLGEET